jgi:hypothetical protein
MDAFQSLISDLAKLTGLPLSPDERDGCILESDGIFFTIQYRAAADGIGIFAPVTDPDAAERPTKAMLEKALALAYKGKGTQGANLGMFNGELILSVQFPMQGLDAETLGLKLSSFADAAVSVKAEIASAMAEGDDDDGGKGVGEANGLEEDISQFMRV